MGSGNDHIHSYIHDIYHTWSVCSHTFNNIYSMGFICGFEVFTCTLDLHTLIYIHSSIDRLEESGHVHTNFSARKICRMLWIFYFVQRILLRTWISLVQWNPYGNSHWKNPLHSYSKFPFNIMGCSLHTEFTWILARNTDGFHTLKSVGNSAV